MNNQGWRFTMQPEGKCSNLRVFRKHFHIISWHKLFLRHIGPKPCLTTLSVASRLPMHTGQRIILTTIVNVCQTLCMVLGEACIYLIYFSQYFYVECTIRCRGLNNHFDSTREGCGWKLIPHVTTEPTLLC